MNTLSFRRVAVVTGSLTAVDALALTGAVGAQAATPATTPVVVGSQATSVAASLTIAGGVPPLKTPAVTQTWKRGDPSVLVESASVPALLPGQSLVSAGVAAGTVTVRKTVSSACTGLLAPGGALQVGNGSVCKATGGTPGVAVDLGSLLTKLPVGVGGLEITATGITARASYQAGVTDGAGSLLNGRISVCLGLTVNGACVGVPQSIPLKFGGTKNEDVVPVIVNALTTVPQLRSLASTLTTLLTPVVQIRTNVQGLNSAGVRTVIGLQVKLLKGGLTSNLASAVAGPRPS